MCIGKSYDTDPTTSFNQSDDLNQSTHQLIDSLIQIGKFIDAINLNSLIF